MRRRRQLRIEKSTCPKCNASSIVRRKRDGILQSLFLPLLKIYPWHCGRCGYKIYRRNRGPGAKVLQPR